MTRITTFQRIALCMLLPLTLSADTEHQRSIARQQQAAALSSIVGAFIAQEQSRDHIINLAGKQRMLTQKMAKLSLMTAMHLSPQHTIKSLRSAADLYDRTLTAFDRGDSTLQITAAKDPHVRQQIATLKKMWHPFYTAIQALTATSGSDKQALAYIVRHNEALLSASDTLVQRFKKAYAPTQNFIEAQRSRIIDIAGRERMLTQRMTKAKLMLIAGIDKPQSRKQLQETIGAFDTALHALIHGDAALKIPRPTNPELIAALASVDRLWRRLKPHYLASYPAKREIVEILTQNEPLLQKMDHAVKLYEKLADY